MSAIRKEHYIVNASNIESLNMQVNEKLREGWELYGELKFNKNSVGVVSFYQALIKNYG